MPAAGCGDLRRLRILLVTYGTRGDVQPFVAIGQALRARGHEVRVACPTNHAAYVTRAGLEALPIAGDSEQLLLSSGGQAVVASGNGLAFLRAMRRLFAELAPRVEADVEALMPWAEGLVAGALPANLAQILAEQFRVPIIFAHTSPTMPSRVFPSALVSSRAFPGPLAALHAWTARLFFRVAWWAVGGRMDDESRARRGLPRSGQDATLRAFDRGEPALHLWSPAFIPRPADWGPQHAITGYCAPSQPGDPPPEDAALPAWLESGPAPIYVGFGSMPTLDPDALGRLVRDAAAPLGLRVLLGPGARAEPTAEIRAVGAVDHGWLFPRCAGVVHHGGAGTTHAGLRAGRPTFVCSVTADQPFWGAAVERAGLGAHAPLRGLTRARFQAGLARLGDPSVVARAAAVGEGMRSEDGAKTAAKAVEAALTRSVVRR